MLVDPAHRLAMVKLAIEGESGFEVSDFDLTRHGPTFTIDTITHFRQTLGPSAARNPDAPYNLATLQLVLGDQAGAAESLQRAVRIPSPSLIWLATDPIWDPVRSQPEVQRLVRRIDAGQRIP